MCGAGGTKKGLDQVIKRTLEAPWDEGQVFVANNNIRPTARIPAVRLTADGRIAGNHIWGFLPPNAPDKRFISEWSTFNARDDRIAKSKLYSQPFRERRSLVVLSVWYEWPKQPGEKKGTACRVKPAQGECFVFAGVWGPWKDPDTQAACDTTTLITTEPNAVIADLPHHRMPAILPPSAWDAWLHPDTPVSVLQDMLHPSPDEWLEIVPGGPAHFSVE
ncbi:MAG: SOS response-associated peptidase [Acidobacteria bacterium]|nr:SOS response-associated peptidase [Acidobacteriota bacterium]